MLAEQASDGIIFVIMVNTQWDDPPVLRHRLRLLTYFAHAVLLK